MSNIFKIEIDPKRIFGLDILRALAILFVVIEHGSYLLPEKLRPICNLFVFDGVSIFFVLSGFLIGGILIKIMQEKGFSIAALKNFWIRRWFRTLPNYFLILFILCILHLFFDDEFTFGSILNYFIFSQNIFTKHPTWFFPEAWSLCVEEWFYLILPLLITTLTFALNKSYKKGIFYASLIVIILVTLFRYYRFSTIAINDLKDWDLLFRKQVITRLDSLMFGVLGAYINYYYHQSWVKFKNQLLIIGILIFIISKFIIRKTVAIDGIYLSVFSFTLLSLATLFILPYLSELKKGKGFLYKPITYLSLTSYSMYLLNLSIVQRWILNNIPWHNYISNGYIILISKYGLYWLLVVGLSILIYKYFEIPMTSLRERLK